MIRKRRRLVGLGRKCVIPYNIISCNKKYKMKTMYQTNFILFLNYVSKPKTKTMYQTENLFHFQFQIGFQVPSSKLEKGHELKTQNENMYQTSPYYIYFMCKK